MAYDRQTWADGLEGGTPLSADRFNYLEAGVEGAAVTADQAITAAEQAATDAAAALLASENSTAVQLETDGTLTVNGLTVEVATDQQLAASSRGDVIYVWDDTTLTYVLAPGQVDDGLSPRAYRGGAPGQPEAQTGHVAREGDVHFAVTVPA